MSLYEELKKLLPEWNFFENKFFKNKKWLNLCKICFDAVIKSDPAPDKLCLVTMSLERIWEELNIGHWSNVSLEIREIYGIFSFLKALLELQTGVSTTTVNKSLSAIDRGILLGAPLRTDSCSDILSRTATILNSWNKGFTDTHFQMDLTNIEIKKSSSSIQILKNPSITYFQERFFIPKIPAIITESIEWPAREKWKNVNYLIELAGSRTVPIEVGKDYSKEDWSQELITFKEFLIQQMVEGSKSDKIKYLAQHNLFEQIPELKNDIIVPDYCCISEDDSKEYEEPDIKAWIGPKGTISPLHYDPKHNLLCQVIGTKKIILARPDDSLNLYPHESSMLLGNTSQIDAENVDYEKFPLVKNVKLMEVILNEGDMLYIPKHFWHFVKSLSTSFSVSFWWE